MEIDKFQMQQRNYEWQMNSINNADSKISLLITLNLAFIGFILIRLDKLIANRTGSCLNFPDYLLLGALIAILLSMVFTIKAIWPRFSNNATSVYYYNSISKTTKDDYSIKINNIGDEALIHDINEQVWILSTIARRKYKGVRNGLGLLVLGILILLLSYCSGF